MPSERPAWIEIDLGAIRHNVLALRRLVGPRVKIFAVCKGDGYGIGAAALAKAAIDAGADAAACSDPEDAYAIQDAGVTAPILLYASTLPQDAAALVARNIILTIHNFESLDALASLDRVCTAYVKLDCGFGRLGFHSGEWDAAFKRMAGCNRLRVAGLYCHLGYTESKSRIDPQIELFNAATNLATRAGLKDFDRMVASSRVVIGHPELTMTAVNPGRMICGILEPPWDAMADIKPVLRALKTRIIQVRTLPAGTTIAYSDIVIDRQIKIAIAPIGFADGYPRLPAGGSALIRGKRVSIIGPRATEHTTFDVTSLPETAVGDEVVMLGDQLGATITGNELAAATGVPLIELLPRLGRSARRVYLR
jgi:alanine racemase